MSDTDVNLKELDTSEVEDNDIILKIPDIDVMALDLAKSKRSIALAEAKTALANNEKAELEYRNVVLQIYLKNGLSLTDALQEDGTILKNGSK